jgi:hypothetical protein
MANYTKNDLDVKLLDENQRVEYQFEFLKHDVHENLDINKTVEGIEHLRKSEQKGFADLMSMKDEQAGDKYMIADKIMMLLMMASLIATLVLVLTYVILFVYNIVRSEERKNVNEEMTFIFRITVMFILLLVILYLTHKGLFYIINNIKVSRNFLNRV